MRGMLPNSFRVPPMYAKICGKSPGAIGTLVVLIWNMKWTSIFTMELAMLAPCGFEVFMFSTTVGWHPRMWYATATRFPWVDTHGCVMPPLWGSIIFFCIPWVPRTLCASPTSVLCHRYAVRWYVTVTRFCGMSPRRGSVVCHRDAVLCSAISVGLHPRLCYATATRFIWRLSFYPILYTAN